MRRVDWWKWARISAVGFLVYGLYSEVGTPRPLAYIAAVLAVALYDYHSRWSA